MSLTSSQTYMKKITHTHRCTPSEAMCRATISVVTLQGHSGRSNVTYKVFVSTPFLLNKECSGSVVECLT